MSLCRQVVGYADRAHSEDTLVNMPEDDGLFALDLDTGESRLLLSIAEVMAALPNDLAKRQPAWFNHVLYNPDGSRVMFFCRIRRPKGRFLDSLWTVNPDGGELECQVGWGHRVSHFAWLDPSRIMISTDLPGQMQFILLRDRAGTWDPVGTGVLPQDGHSAVSPNGRWVACDGRFRPGERTLSLMLYEFATGSHTMLGHFSHPAQYTGVCRCDLHPRWSRDGHAVTFDSVHEGSRQIYFADVSDIVDTD
jgi:hypothetical protein